MMETKFKIAIRRYSSPYKMNNQEKNDRSFSCLFKNLDGLNQRRICEKTAQLKDYSNVVTRQYSRDHSEERISLLNKYSFQLQYVIGVGGFGRVWKVVYKKQIYAMKEISKALVLLKQSGKSIMSELQFLTELRHNFQSILFQHSKTIRIFIQFQITWEEKIQDFIQDSKGNSQKNKQVFKIQDIYNRIFAACIIIGLEYLHDNNIIHRDIKPENLILDNYGYVRITDLSVSIRKSDQNFKTSGTHGYMAPEVIFRQDHGKAVDFFALGVICHEFMTGRRPYNGSRREIREQILAKQIQIYSSNEGWSKESLDFINQLLQRKPQYRLNNPRQHRWFKNFPFEQLVQKRLKAPFIPINQDNFDKSQIFYEDEENNQIIKLNQHLVRENQQVFEGYMYQQKKQQQFNIKQRKSNINNIKIFSFN